MVSLFLFVATLMTSSSYQPLEDAYANLDINDDDDLKVDIDANLVTDAQQDFRWTPVGRLLGTGNIVFEAFIQLMASLWRPKQGVLVRELGDGRYLFQFFHEMDLAKMLNYGPWTFENRLLITHRVQPGDNLHEVTLNTVPLWAVFAV